MKTSPAALRAAGLSGAKLKTLKAIATAVRNDSLNLLSLKKIPETDIAKELMSMWGLGPWSVEMFLMFALGRGDVFSPGDLGLVRAMKTIYGLPKNASRTSLLAIAENGLRTARTRACFSGRLEIQKDKYLLRFIKDTKAG